MASMNFLNPYVLNHRHHSQMLEAPTASLVTRSSGIALWRPDVVLPKAIVPAPERPRVTIAEPGQRPDAVRAQVEATRSLLDSLVEARQAFHSRTADLDPAAGGSERERVTTMIETYRAKGALDEALRGTLRRAGTMMDTRGQR